MYISPSIILPPVTLRTSDAIRPFLTILTDQQPYASYTCLLLTISSDQVLFSLQNIALFAMLTFTASSVSAFNRNESPDASGLENKLYSVSRLTLSRVALRERLILIHLF